MKKISLTTMILLALVLGMIIGVVLNNTASPETENSMRKKYRYSRRFSYD